MRLLQGIHRYRKLAGIRGLLTICSHHLFGEPCEIKVACPAPGGGAPVHLRLRTSDIDVFKEVFIDKEYDVQLPFEPKAIVDCGANIGMTSIFFANRYPAARIVAVEPEDSNFKMLTKNVHNYPNKVFPCKAALWNEDGEISLVSKSGFHKSEFISREGKGCRALSLGTLMHEAGIDSIDLLKVDIEGAEKWVFESWQWTDRVRAVVIELHDDLNPGCRRAVEAALSGWIRAQYRSTTLFVRDGF